MQRTVLWNCTVLVAYESWCLVQLCMQKAGACKSGGAGQSERGLTKVVVSVITSVIGKETVT